VKVEQLLHRLRRKNKEKWEKNIIFLISRGKNMKKLGKKHIFSPMYTVCESRTIIAWRKGKK
jgi:hypothetical protein